VDSICSVVRLHSRHIALSTVNHCMSALAIAMSARAARLMSSRVHGYQDEAALVYKVEDKKQTRILLRKRKRMMAKSIISSRESVCSTCLL
jgi:hypothetical protein